MTASFSRAVRRAYKSSPQGRLDALLEERRIWQRKQTIARNKLAKVQQKLDEMLNTMVKAEMEKGKSNE